MEIQRGDQVYYRGEVWTVEGVRTPSYQCCILQLHRVDGTDSSHWEEAHQWEVQHVEQVR